MSIATLSTLSLDTFKGARGLAGRGSTSLVGHLNTIIAKINAMVAVQNLGDFDALSVGGGLDDYYAGDNSWLEIDGTNPPTLSAFRMIDTDDGTYKTVTMASGALSVA